MVEWNRIESNGAKVIIIKDDHQILIWTKKIQDLFSNNSDIDLINMIDNRLHGWFIPCHNDDLQKK